MLSCLQYAIAVEKAQHCPESPDQKPNQAAAGQDESGSNSINAAKAELGSQQGQYARAPSQAVSLRLNPLGSPATSVNLPAHLLMARTYGRIMPSLVCLVLIRLLSQHPAAPSRSLLAPMQQQLLRKLLTALSSSLQAMTRQMLMCQPRSCFMAGMQQRRLPSWGNSRHMLLNGWILLMDWCQLQGLRLPSAMHPVTQALETNLRWMRSLRMAELTLWLASVWSRNPAAAHTQKLGMW